MQYAILIYGEESTWEARTPEERVRNTSEHMALGTTSGLSGGAELRPTASATTVRVRGGETLVVDGPFAETKEALGGLYFLEADSLDEAIAFAARVPEARNGSIEVRPVVPH